MGQFYQLCQQKISASEVSRAGDWERGKGVTLPSPDLSSLRFARRDFWLSPIFFAAYFPHCGAWSQAKRPKTQTEYRKSKGGKDRQNLRSVNGWHFKEREKQLPCVFQLVLGLVC